MTSAYHSAYLLSACWSPTRPAVFFSTKMDGTLDVWDYFYKVNEPTLTLQVDDDGLQCLKVQEAGNILATGSVDGSEILMLVTGSLGGSVYLMELCGSLANQQPQEKQSMQQMLDREFKKEKGMQQVLDLEFKKEKNSEALNKLIHQLHTHHTPNKSYDLKNLENLEARNKELAKKAVKEQEAQRDPTALQPTDDALKQVEQEFYDTIAEYEQNELEASRKD
ncbi:hypothetical protein T492DRAFT_834525 [Pavlovales sp. CCMP2436]|nr:hypothetical protein T492DRAFT_834525 [Pavlovales sp. CCMP2436]